MSKGDFLGALIRVGEGAYGMTVRREIGERAERDVSIGAVYATLARLEEKGLVKSYRDDGSDARGGRPKKCINRRCSWRS